MTAAVIRSTGLWTPANSISNEELVESFNAYVAQYNQEHAAAIEAGELAPLSPSSAEFVEKASGIKSRFVIDKEGVLDTKRMKPFIPARDNTDISILAEIGVKACHNALERAGKTASDVDGVIVAASNLQRGYPAVAVEIQDALGIEDGFGFDMNVACSSATFGIQTAADQIAAGHARAILVVNPEICSAHLNWCDRDSHFIFGDVATAILLEREDLGEGGWRIIGTKLKTKFSNNIRNNFGFLNRAERPTGEAGQENLLAPKDDKLFVQEGRKVFKEVVPMVSDMIRTHMGELGLEADDMRRVWLHQANINMNLMIAKKVFGREAGGEDAPTILDEYANTSSAGSIIAFHKHSDDFTAGQKGVICSFGAGYSAGTVFVERL
ncbi:MAG: beta-ketoacyl-ACP synthase III [Oceanicaulis sp.]|uniref:beta-ketoacyl-ACP synthase III n=1 Tax=unclassified Oceanicaulis TaxID=2632123 RepID=UPI000C52B40C|nr:MULTISPECIES: beta-ketoacyl-ACP synthase III [unclassified Oceanicaulis]MBC39451.1 beta-ketoacyl-ACP synthase III [Oceanicaulis sp.]MBG35064.1 beta-ketoacyl-ACP synthase III [Oceanicaulis sp.]HBU62540.1 beta-ketoacyl-ACP synthase III [Oceanicaulis sp.]|tara:strand:+ start:1079 stop:2224 length:1146 start_codon:yes stop_codon:yes gene_type:complete